MAERDGWATVPHERGEAQTVARALLDQAWRASASGQTEDRIAARTLRWARAALALGDTRRAGELLRIADTAMAREVPALHPLRGEALYTRARWLLATGDAAGAGRAADACTRMLLNFHPRSHPLLAQCSELRLRATGKPVEG